VSNFQTVAVVRALKAMGAPVTAEVSPHHLTLTDGAVELHGTHAKMKPPLCGAEDREALILAVEDGTIDCIATDHAPHAAGLKAKGMEGAPFGIIGLETAMAVIHKAFVESGRWSIGFAVEKMSSAPARVVGWEPGSIREGARADLAVWDLERRYTLCGGHLGSRSENSPWVGETFGAGCVMTICGGRSAYADERIGVHG
jgi:dihydroorotase